MMVGKRIFSLFQLRGELPWIKGYHNIQSQAIRTYEETRRYSQDPYVWMSALLHPVGLMLRYDLHSPLPHEIRGAHWLMTLGIHPDIYRLIIYQTQLRKEYVLAEKDIFDNIPDLSDILLLNTCIQRAEANSKGDPASLSTIKNILDQQLPYCLKKI